MTQQTTLPINTGMTPSIGIFNATNSTYALYGAIALLVYGIVTNKPIIYVPLIALGAVAKIFGD